MVRQLIENATNVHYETLPAGTVYNTWYTALDENGDPQLVQSEGISHDHNVTLLVMDVQVNGQEVTLKINSECGQGISAQMYDNVPVFIPDTNTSDQSGGGGDNGGGGNEEGGGGGDNGGGGGEDGGDTRKSDRPEHYAREDGKTPVQVISEPENPANIQQENPGGGSSSDKPDSETNTNAAGTNNNTPDANGSVEGGGDGQTNTDTVAGP